MTVVIKEPKHDPYTAVIDGSLESMQKVVGGFIETVGIAPSVYMVCNEMGKLDGLPANFALGCDIIVGTVFFCGLNDEGDDLGDIPSEWVDILFRAFASAR